MPTTDHRIDLIGEPSDDVILRDRFSRGLCTIVSTAMLVFGPTILVGQIGFLCGGFEFTGKLIGFCLGMATASVLVPKRMIIRIPENTGYATQNMFTGALTAYGPGDHWTYWWELRNAKGNYTLQLIEDSVVLAISTATSEVKVKVDYMCRRSLKYLAASIKFGKDSTTARNGLEGFMESSLTQYCADKEAVSLREKKEVKEIDRSLADEFVARGKKYEEASTFEKRYGFEVVSLVVSNVELSEGVQTARDAADESRAILMIVAERFGCANLGELNQRRTLSSNDPKKITNETFDAAYKDALVVSKKANMHIHAFSGNSPEGIRMNLTEQGGDHGKK